MPLPVASFASLPWAPEGTLLWNHGDGLDLDQPVGPDQRRHADQRARGWPLGANILTPNLAEDRDVLGLEADHLSSRPQLLITFAAELLAVGVEPLLDGAP